MLFHANLFKESTATDITEELFLFEVHPFDVCLHESFDGEGLITVRAGVDGRHV